MLDRLACSWEASGFTRFGLMTDFLGRPRFNGRFVVWTVGSDLTMTGAGVGAGAAVTAVVASSRAFAMIVPGAPLRRSSRKRARDSRIVAGVNDD